MNNQSRTADPEKLNEFINGYIECLISNLDVRTEPTNNVDWYFGETSSVVGTLLARQMTVSMHLASSPTCWNGHVAPLFLRTMIDGHISLAWILAEPEIRAREYISYSLGQAKLAAGHLRAKIEGGDKDPRVQRMLDTKEEWINHHMMMELVEVNLGSWSGSSVRQMCKDINDEDFYNFSFTPFSSCVHNTWEHIGIYNSWPCQNPLHKSHLIPAILDISPDLDYVFRTAKYASMSIRAFDEALGIEINQTLPIDYFKNEEGEIYSDFDDTEVLI